MMAACLTKFISQGVNYVFEQVENLLGVTRLFIKLGIYPFLSRADSAAANKCVGGKNDESELERVLERDYRCQSSRLI